MCYVFIYEKGKNISTFWPILGGAQTQSIYMKMDTSFNCIYTRLFQLPNKRKQFQRSYQSYQPFSNNNSFTFYKII